MNRRWRADVKLRFELSLIAAITLAGCQAQFGVPQNPVRDNSLVETTTRAAALGPRSDASPTPVVYVAPGYGPVLIYAQKGAIRKPIGSIDGFKYPDSLIVDANGDLYVMDEGVSGGSHIDILHHGDTTPYRVLTVPDSTGAGVAVDSAGNVYANCDDYGTVYVFAPGSTTPTSTLTTSWEQGGSGLAVDAAGDVFAASTDAQEIDEFPAGSSQPIRIFPGYQVGGLAFDGDQNLLVGSSFKIDVYAPPYTGQPLRSIDLQQPLLLSSMALDASGKNLWTIQANSLMVGSEFTYPAFFRHHRFRISRHGSYGFAGIAPYPAFSAKHHHRS